jgi:hypothetical protein
MLSTRNRHKVKWKKMVSNKEMNKNFSGKCKRTQHRRGDAKFKGFFPHDKIQNVTLYL